MKNETKPTKEKERKTRRKRKRKKKKTRAGSKYKPELLSPIFLNKSLPLSFCLLYGTC